MYRLSPLLSFYLYGVLDKRLASDTNSYGLEVSKLLDRQECIAARIAEASAAVPAVLHLVEKPVKFSLTVETVESQVLRDPHRRFAGLVVSCLMTYGRSLIRNWWTLTDFLHAEKLRHRLYLHITALIMQR